MKSLSNTEAAIDLQKLHKVHCVGIGGIGVSAIALMLKERGVGVTGSDASESYVAESLRSKGIPVALGHSASHVPADIDCLIYTIAVPTSNPERQEAARLGVPQMSYPEMLGLVSAKMKTIAVSGTHGKTTTTAMISKAMIECGLDPTVVVGSFMNDPKREVRRNFIAGASDYLVVEACEYRRSFLNLYPTILVITSIEEDHLDYYKDLADIQSAFREIALRVPAGGAIICDAKDPAVASVIADVAAKIVDYTEYLDAGKHTACDLKVPGEHNRRDAAAARAVLHFLGADDAKACESLKSFGGTWRRFEYKGLMSGAGMLPAARLIAVYDDYAHHPTEIRATLQGARELFNGKHVLAIFQPHLYSRTKDLFADFSAAFSDADEVFLAPIYAARETPDPSIDSVMLAEAISKQGKNARAFPDLTSIVAAAKASNADAIIVMGAGDITKVADRLVAARDISNVAPDTAAM